MSKKLKIAFHDGADFCQKLICSLLQSSGYLVSIDQSNPDLLVYSLYGMSHKQFRCKKLLIIGENSFPNFNECDYAISPHYLTLGKRHCRIPFYVFNKEYSLLCNKERDMVEDPFNRMFCSAMISNNSNSDPMRENFLKKLHQRKPIHSIGRALNTTGYLLPERPIGAENLDTSLTNPAKIDFLKRFKFNLAMENSSVDGYCTEKITDAFVANTIPIYWGDKKVANEFPQSSFINISDFTSIDDAIDFILKIDSDQQEYLKMLNSFQMVHKDYLQILQKFLIDCVEGETFEHSYGNIKLQLG